jgi:hypothetical protein
MWIKIISLILFIGIIVIISLTLIERRKIKKHKNPVNELDNLTTAQLKEQLTILKQHSDNLSKGFIGKTIEEQKKAIERLNNINEKIERLKDALADRGEYEFTNE